MIISFKIPHPRRSSYILTLLCELSTCRPTFAKYPEPFKSTNGFMFHLERGPRIMQSLDSVPRLLPGTKLGTVVNIGELSGNAGAYLGSPHMAHAADRERAQTHPYPLSTDHCYSNNNNNMWNIAPVVRRTHARNGTGAYFSNSS